MTVSRSQINLAHKSSTRKRMRVASSPNKWRLHRHNWVTSTAELGWAPQERTRRSTFNKSDNLSTFPREPSHVRFAGKDIIPVSRGEFSHDTGAKEGMGARQEFTTDVCEAHSWWCDARGRIRWSFHQRTRRFHLSNKLRNTKYKWNKHATINSTTKLFWSSLLEATLRTEMQ